MSVQRYAEFSRISSGQLSVVHNYLFQPPSFSSWLPQVKLICTEGCNQGQESHDYSLPAPGLAAYSCSISASIEAKPTQEKNKC